MRSAPSILTGSSLTFDRGGNRLVAIDSDAISIVELASSKTRRIACAARTAIAFEDQLWLATADDRLVRMDLEDRPIGEPAPLAFTTSPLLLAAPCGPPAAVWLARPAHAFVDDFGELVDIELVDADAIIPLTGRRHIVATGARVVLPSGMTAKLAPGSDVLGGAVTADGKLAVLLLSQTSGRQLVTLALGSAQIVHRFTAASAMVRLAQRRGLALLQVDTRALRVVDARTGRDLGTILVDRDFDDVAIDPEGRSIVLRHGASVEIHDLAELMQRTTPRSTIAPAPEPAKIDCKPEPAEPAPPPVVTVAPEPLPRASLVALSPRTRPAATDPARARHQLELDLQSVALWTLGAIASAWDSRRIAYGNEGKHPYELEVAAILGLTRGHATEYVEAARDRLAAHEATLAQDASWRADDAPISALIREFGLSARSIDVLLVIAAAALWGEIARLYGILANDVARGLDELVVQQVLAARHDRHDIAAELDPRAPLVRLGLVHVATRRPRPFAELAVDPVVLDILRAKQPELGDAIAVRCAERALDALDIPRDVIASAIGALSRSAASPVRIVVRGRVGSGRTTLLAALAGEASRDLAVIDAHALPRTSEAFVVELGRALRRAQLTGLVPCITHLDEVTFDEHPARDVVAETLRVHPGPIAVIVAPDAPAPFPAGHVAIELPVLAETARRDVWLRAVGDAELEVADVDVLAARYRIGPGLVRRAAAVARAEVARGVDATAALDHYIRQTRDARLGRYARRVERLASWSSVVLPGDILDSLRELVGRVRHRRTVFDTWGMDRTMATSRGLTALFQGLPGTGKTLVASVIARELGLDLYQVDLSKVMSKWIGETERNLSQIFDAAEDGQVILLFDEADSLFAKRTEVRSSNDRYANLEVNYLLQRLDAFEGIAILTTNIGGSIDHAFKRRMSFRLSFPFPDEDTREQLWRAHLPRELPTAGPLALDVLAHKYQLSGGYIRNACLRAAFLAAQEETTLHQRHLERAVALEFAELGKLSSSGAID